MNSLSIPVEALDELQARYIRALDTQDMAGWLATFANDPEAAYICTTQENERRNLPLALILDDCHARLEDRVTYITKIWAGTFQNYQTRHLTQRLHCEQGADGHVNVESGFAVYCTPDETGVTMLLATGIYHDTILMDGAVARFYRKKVVMDTFVIPRYLVYPI